MKNYLLISCLFLSFSGSLFAQSTFNDSLNICVAKFDVISEKPRYSQYSTFLQDIFVNGLKQDKINLISKLEENELALYVDSSRSIKNYNFERETIEYKSKLRKYCIDKKIGIIITGKVKNFDNKFFIESTVFNIKKEEFVYFTSEIDFESNFFYLVNQVVNQIYDYLNSLDNTKIKCFVSKPVGWKYSFSKADSLAFYSCNAIITSYLSNNYTSKAIIDTNQLSFDTSSASLLEVAYFMDKNNASLLFGAAVKRGKGGKLIVQPYALIKGHSSLINLPSKTIPDFDFYCDAYTGAIQDALDNILNSGKVQLPGILYEKKPQYTSLLNEAEQSDDSSQAYVKFLILQKCIELYPKEIFPYTELVRLKMKQMKYDIDIPDLLEKAISINKYYSDAYLLLGQYYSTIGSFEKSINSYNRILDKNADAYKSRGVTFFRMGEYRSSLDDFFRSAEFTKGDKEQADILYYISSSYYELGVLDSANIYLEKSYALDSSNAFTKSRMFNNLLDKADLFAQQGKKDSASLYYDKAFLYERNIIGYEKYREFCNKNKNYTKANTIIENGIRDSVYDKKKIYLTQAFSLYRLRDNYKSILDTVINLINRQTENNGAMDASSANLLGNISYGQGDYLKAELHFAQAIKIVPDEPVYYLNLAEVYIVNGKSDSCKILLEQNSYKFKSFHYSAVNLYLQSIAKMIIANSDSISHEDIISLEDILNRAKDGAYSNWNFKTIISWADNSNRLNTKQKETILSWSYKFQEKFSRKI